MQETCATRSLHQEMAVTRDDDPLLPCSTHARRKRRTGLAAGFIHRIQ
jgi:hypothetical protein